MGVVVVEELEETEEEAEDVLVCSYSLTNRSDAPLTVIGNVTSTVRASGKAANGRSSGCGSCSSNSNGIVSGLGFVGLEVAA